ncbi:MAG: hypothetical protein M3069_03090, partial [Chloroflexota bacterium]|nr:hypothetical protein [Chloroflexota bacterium]
ADPCDESQLPAFALELWGLPTSLPTSDPLNTDFVYQRFQKGIMHYSRATGLTQGLLLGDWLKRIMVGVDLSPDIGADVRHSRFFAQYAPSRPLALDRPNDLPDTSLAQAFRADTLSAAGQMQPEPTLPPSVAQTATAVALTVTAITATQTSFQGTQTPSPVPSAQLGLTQTAVALTQTAAALASTPAAGQLTPSPTPVTAVSSVPVVNVGCMGDEQLWFTPRKPNVGTHVDISVTSQRHHDARSMRLTGPIDAGPVTEHLGPLGFVWTWTIVPTVQDFYDWTFYADGLRPCINSGFNAYLPLGSTSTPTLTPQATNTAGPTSTPTSTVVPVPSITTATQNGTCGSVITIVGSNFGSPPSNVGTSVQLLAGPSGAGANSAGTPKLLNLIGGSNTQLTATLPSTGLLSGGGYFLVVSNNGGASNTVSFTINGSPNTTC